ncbi:MAG: large conductance mechanosensitive channel protein MscL [Clostridia bacterium]|nr:large conductance mechanosensitive channel protein MscL [Clostridia bacterium]
MKKFLKEFKEFALKGNVLDLAVGVIIGAAFKDIVTSLTDNFINPILQFITAGDPIETTEIGVYASNFVTAVINFIIMAFILFCIVKAINKMMTIGKKKEEPAAPTTKKCPFCMSEIAIEATRCPHCTSVIPEEEKEEAEV